MRGLEACAEGIASGNPDRRTAEIHIRIAFMIRFSARGSAEILRAARHH
jgi:hypothetical protein